MASTSSSHPQNAFSGIEPPNKRRRIEESSRVHDVFINHRGPDVKDTLATWLYNSLKDLDIRAFLDSEEKELGDSFPSTIETAICSAKVHIAIFSPRYAESAWCLAELVLMLQSTAKIIPVFYEVKPSDLRHIETGVYAEAFNKYEQKGRYLDKLNTWNEALEQVSYTAGYEFKISDSSECKDIVSAVEKEVQRTKRLHVAKYPVGLHKLIKDFERRCLGELVKDFESQCGMKKAAKGKANVVGIFGMGGVGKTTLSLELFNQKRSKYTRACFLYDVREAYARGTLPLLQSQLVKDIFCEGNRSFPSNKEGTSYLRDRLQRSSCLSFLIVLDDIDHVEQLEALLPMEILNNHGNNNHLVIITTRDVGVLVSAGIDIAYHLRGFNKEDGRELFCWHAFDQPLPLGGYEDLVQDFVNVCGGLPLSLIVLGRHVSGRAQWYWRDELEKVKETLPGDIKQRLKISIDTLDYVEKQIFMDIACFFIGKSITKAMLIWKGSGWRARHALETLKERCLVEEVKEVHLNRLEYKWESSAEGSALRMHDHLRDFGREMADELSYPRRVWRPQDLKSLELKGFQSILTQSKSRCFHSIVDKSIGCEITYFLGEPKDGSDASLLWLQLEYLSYLPLDLNSDINSSIFPWIPLQNLQCLRISNGCFQQLWQSDVQAPSNLRELQIHSTFLEEFPDLLGKLSNMDKLVLHARDIQTDIRSLLESLRMNLRSLKMMDSALEGDLGYNSIAERTTQKSLVIYDFKLLWEGELALNNEEWSRTVMSGVENLEINGYELVMKILINGNCCQSLKSLKICELKNLVEADLARIKTLNCLEITNCENFKRFSATSDLCTLVELKISECLELEDLRLAHLSCLEKITIENCNYLKSVSGISKLAKLVELKISGCHMLEAKELKLAHLRSLEKITIGNCNHLKNVSGISNLTKLVELEISGCQMLEFEFPCLNDMKHLERIAVDRNVNMECFELDSCKNLRTVMIGCKNIVQLSIRNCAELETLADLIGPTCLKRIIIDGCGNLKYIRLDGLENLEILSGNMELRQLDINKCPALEELPSLARMSCLQKIQIDSCEKLRSIILPSTLLSVWLKRCRDLKSIEGIADLTKLTFLEINQCPALEELPSLARLSCLEKIQILLCEKLQSIILPPTLLRVCVESCRDLRSVEGIADLTKLTFLKINQCPALEELPSLARMSCLQNFQIDSCEKLRSIILPSTLLRVCVESCRDLRSIEGIADLTKLTFLEINQCPALEELPSLARLSCLEKIQILFCEKLQSIILPTTLLRVCVESCRDLRSIEGIADLTKLTFLKINQCPALEELPSLARLSCLEKIQILLCEKLRSIILPSTLLSVWLKRCRDLKSIEGIADLTKLTFLEINQCPALEELPSLAGLSCLEEIQIGSCKELQSIILPTTLLSVWVESCRDLQSIEGIANLTKLTFLKINQCPGLEELPSLAGLSCLEEIQIGSCEKLRSIILPSTLLRVCVESCRDLRSIEGIADLTKLTFLEINQCPALEELPSLARLSCLEKIQILLCEKLQSIILPPTLLRVCVESCRDLWSVEGIADLTKLTFLKINQCPALEELPSLARMSCSQKIQIDSCEKLRSIILPSTLLRVCVESCRDLRSIEGIADLTKLTFLEINQCPALEELPSLARLSCLEKIQILLCEKLQSIILPPTLLRVCVESCRDMRSVEGIADLTKLTFLKINQCPALEELSSLARISCL